MFLSPLFPLSLLLSLSLEYFVKFHFPLHSSQISSVLSSNSFTPKSLSFFSFSLSPKEIILSLFSLSLFFSLFALSFSFSHTNTFAWAYR